MRYRASLRVDSEPCLFLAVVSAFAPIVLGQPEETGNHGVTFVDESVEAGLTFMNVSGSTNKDFIPETTGSGACFLDFDLDQDLDLYLVNGATFSTLGAQNPARDALYENVGGARFVEVTERAGVGDPGWGGGCTVADYDNDGDPDLYITNYGRNTLYRNEGKGTFTDATAFAGVGVELFSTGAAFVDVDRDGRLDLYVANYLRFGPEELEKFPPGSGGCFWKGAPVMCGPRGLAAEPDVLFHNEGDGTFVDVSAASGVSGRPLYGLGVVAGDLDLDLDPDIVVANDSEEKNLFVNDGFGRFEDKALVAGVAFSGDGRAQASMGVDIGDYDNDGDYDLFLTNFSDDYHTLYRNDGNGFFTDASMSARLDDGIRSSLGWAGLFFDYDNDGDLDIYVAGGHVYPQVDEHDPVTSYRQRNLLFRNEGDGRFANVTEVSGPGLTLVRSSRGVALGDYDDDGDMDLLVANENDAPDLLRNDGGNRLHWLKVRVVGRQSNRDGIGSRLRVKAGGREQMREVRLSSGYYSSHDPRIHIGLGRAPEVERLSVMWPSGKEQIFEHLPVNQLATIDEENGLVSLSSLDGAERARRDVPTRETSLLMPSPSGEPARAFSTGNARRLSPRDLAEIEGLFRAGTTAILAGRYSDGIDAYEGALARLPPWEAAAESPDALGFGEPERFRLFLSGLYDNLGVGLMRAERLDECADPIENAISILPERAKYHHNLGLCRFHSRRYSDAAAAFEQARRLDSDRPEIHYDLGRALALGGDCAGSIPALELAIDELPPTEPRGLRAESWYYMGTCYLWREEFQRAAESFREALALVPGHQKSLYKLQIAFRRMGKPIEADHATKLFHERRATEESVRAAERAGARSLMDHVRLGRAYLEAGIAPQAIQEARTVLADSPDDSNALLLLAEGLLALRPPDFEMARRTFERLLRRHPESPEALAGMGEVLRREGSVEPAARLFREALSRKPEHTGARIGLARVGAAEGSARIAATELEAILTQHPDNPEVIEALAEVYVAAPPILARPREAIELLDRTESLYGHGIKTRIRALVLLGDREAALRAIEDSPFLGASDRETLLAMAGTEK